VVRDSELQRADNSAHQSGKASQWRRCLAKSGRTSRSSLTEEEVEVSQACANTRGIRERRVMMAVLLNMVGTSCMQHGDMKCG
jgi:hypothetical protein